MDTDTERAVGLTCKVFTRPARKFCFIVSRAAHLQLFENILKLGPHGGDVMQTPTTENAKGEDNHFNYNRDLVPFMSTLGSNVS